MKKERKQNYNEYRELVDDSFEYYWVSEDEDIDKSLKIAKDAYYMYERDLIDDRIFLMKYTSVSEDPKYFQLNKSDLPIFFCVASMMKFGGKDLLSRLIKSLESEKHKNLIQIKVQPK